MRESREFAAEIKFQVPEVAAEQILDWARTRLVPDPNANEGGQRDGYQITSLYFDTEAFDVFHRRGSFGRSKYRIRRYGPNRTVFLERKLKTRGMVSKRRAAVQIEELARLQESEPDPGWPGFWYHQRLEARQLRPICQITYQRTARVAMTENGPIRLTVDRCIRAVPLQKIAFDETAPGTQLSPEDVIVEAKFRVGMPILFKELVEGFALSAKRLSKYRLAAATLGLVSAPETPVAEPAKAVCLNS
ncbi:MAG TPA: polyphosphate polymerase domain-containing protein [Patescibacteria group bacterium]|nr:polyphosphate polymerase domain-containing protein [Patescibacteria group bacterium]